MSRIHLALLLLFGRLALAQQDNASILGLVSDSSGAIVPNAAVEIHNKATGQTTKLLTDSNGNFFAPVLPVGMYRITVSAPGFKNNVLDNLTLRVADRLRIAAQLEPGTCRRRSRLQPLPRWWTRPPTRWAAW